MQPQYEYLQPMSTAVTRPARLAPKEQAWVDLFNAVHTWDALSLRVDFAAVLPRRPADLPPEREGLRNAAFSWPGKRHPYLVPLEALLARQGRLLKSLLGRLDKDDVALAVPHLPEELWHFLHERGYYREVAPRQHEGWFAESQEATREPPEYKGFLQSCGGLLPPQGREGLMGRDCLLLLEVGYQWMVMSKEGLLARAWGYDLFEGKQVRFLCSKPQEMSYAVRLQRWVSADKMEPLWGSIAQERAAEDVVCPVVTVEPWDGERHRFEGTFTLRAARGAGIVSGRKASLPHQPVPQGHGGQRAGGVADR
jgi:hypothetical protein